MDINTSIFLIVTCASFISGFIDSIAGGGGLIIVPTLLIIGLAPINALAVTKLQAAFGTASAVFYFMRKGLIKVREQRPQMISTFFFGSLGSWMVTHISRETLNVLIPVLLILAAIYAVVSPSINDTEKLRRISPMAYALCIGSLIGFYDGFFGPGSGSFYILSLTTFLGYSATRASANAKLLNFCSNLGANFFFISQGYVIWDLAVIMAVSNILGNVVGSKLVLLKGSKVVKPFLVVISISMAARELYEMAH